jgi:hypothetical protein
VENCPLCGKRAAIELPVWSGGRYFFDCKSCGAFSSNKITVDELNILREQGSVRISELQTSIATADHQWNITKHPRLNQIVLESGPSREMTKREKKLKRRTKTVTVGLVYDPSPVDHGDEKKDA